MVCQSHLIHIILHSWVAFKLSKNCSDGNGKIMSSLIKIHEKKIEIMIPLRTKSPNHPSRKKYRVPSIIRHNFLT